MENLEKLSQFKDLILASVSHDLKTPIISISSQIQSAMDCDDFHQIKEFLAVALKSTKMLDYQVKDIMDYSYYLRHGKVRIKSEKFKLGEVLDGV